jgi:hypothetical protein
VSTRLARAATITKVAAVERFGEDRCPGIQRVSMGRAEGSIFGCKLQKIDTKKPA